MTTPQNDNHCVVQVSICYYNVEHQEKCMKVFYYIQVKSLKKDSYKVHVRIQHVRFHNDTKDKDLHVVPISDINFLKEAPQIGSASMSSEA